MQWVLEIEVQINEVVKIVFGRKKIRERKREIKRYESFGMVLNA